MRQLVFLLMLLPSVAAAREYEVTLGMTMQLHHDASMDAVSTTDMREMPTYTVATNLPDVLPLVHAYGEAGFAFGGVAASALGLYETSFDFEEAWLGARVVRQLHRQVGAYGRVGVGFVHGELAIESTGVTGASTLRDGDYAPTTRLAVGVEGLLVRAKKGWKDPDFALGLQVELSYVQAGELSFAAQPDYPDDDLARVDTIAAPLGTLDASGPAWRFAVVGRF